jgi:hypothetical protein
MRYLCAVHEAGSLGTHFVPWAFPGGEKRNPRISGPRPTKSENSGFWIPKRIGFWIPGGARRDLYRRVRSLTLRRFHFLNGRFLKVRKAGKRSLRYKRVAGLARNEVLRAGGAKYDGGWRGFAVRKPKRGKDDSEFWIAKFPCALVVCSGNSGEEGKAIPNFGSERRATGQAQKPASKEQEFRILDSEFRRRYDEVLEVRRATHLRRDDEVPEVRRAAHVRRDDEVPEVRGAARLAIGH